MSRRRWVWAVGLLKLARVLGDQVASADTFLIEDVGECAEAIERAVRAVEEQGDGDVDHAAAEGGGEDAEGASTEVRRSAGLCRRLSLMVLRLGWSACQRSVICRIQPGKSGGKMVMGQHVDPPRGAASPLSVSPQDPPHEPPR